MKVTGILKVKVDMVEKERLFKGEKHTYLDLYVDIDTENQDQFGYNGWAKQSAEKGTKMPILANFKMFSAAVNKSEEAKQHIKKEPEFEDDSIPF